MLKQLAFVLLGFGILSCSAKQDLKTSVSGNYQFIVAHDAEGEVIQEGEIVVATLIGKDNNDSVRYDIYPLLTKKDTALWNKGENGMYEIFNDVSAGDSLIFTISAEKFFTQTARAIAPEWVAKDSVTEFTFYVRIDHVFTMEEYQAFMQEEQSKKMKEMLEEEAANAPAVAAENESQILEYLQANNIQATKDESGMYYVITQPGTGNNIVGGNGVVANYTGYMLDGTYFDTSIEEAAKNNGVYQEGRPYEPFEFVVDESAVIQGWHLGFKLLNKGAKATLFIPSSLGWGSQGSGPVIKPNAVTVFEVEVIDVK